MYPNDLITELMTAERDIAVDGLSPEELEEQYIN